MTPDYHTFTAADFAADEFFQEWVLNPTREGNAFWKNWIREHPDKAEIIANACQIILALKTQREHEPDPIRKQQIWKSILEANAAFDARREQANAPSRTIRPFFSTQLGRWSRVAAAILIVLAVGIGIVVTRLNGHGNTVEEATAFGETRTVVLPDGSNVILNANSKISYSQAWTADQSRDVWLNGEAYFSVVHTKSNQKFIVHTSEDVSVEVLGTTFDVLRRADRTRVVLNSGSIKLNLYADAKHEEVLMKPGELLEFQKEPLEYVKKAANARHFSSWTENKLTFDGTPLSDLVSVLEENYGLRVVVSDSTLLGQKLWGSVPSNDATLLLQAITTSFDFKIKEVGDRVIISRAREQRGSNRAQ